MNMQGNTILVAGGTRGIGRGLAELLCRLGNEVLVFDAEPGVARAVAAAHPGMRAVDLDLTDPWSVTAFSEQVAATCPRLNLLVDVLVAFPAKYLPGLQALLDEDDTHEKLEAHRLGVQHLTGTLLPHFRKQRQAAVLTVSAGPTLVPLHARQEAASGRPAFEGGMQASALSVRKRWVSACIEVLDVALPSRAERPGGAPLPARGLSRAEFISRVAHLLAEGLHESAAVSRLRALWPDVAPAWPAVPALPALPAVPGARDARDQDLLSEAV
jgi:uncharacterized oxidoreductase